MSEFQTISLSIENSIAQLTLNRIEKRNAINEQMICELREACELLTADDAVRAVILTATGNTFCAGGDLDWMKQQAQKDRAGKVSQSTRLAKLLRELDELPKPLIAKVNGSVYGGGVGLISVCDIAIATSGVKFALTETRLGLIPATIGPYVVRCLGETNARQVFMTGKVFDANTALRFGLISSIVDEIQLDEAINVEIDALLQCEPAAVAQAKSLCLRLARDPAQDVLMYTANLLADRWETEQAQEGINAFFNRKKPPWIK